MISVEEKCQIIEKYMEQYGIDQHDLLYEKTLFELQGIDLRGIFIKLNDVPLFRTRLNDENNSKLIEVNQILYAPSGNVTNYGRVNRPGQSMFYCSEDKSISMLELLYDFLKEKKIGYARYVTQTEWKIKDTLNLLIIALPPKNREYINGFTLRKECFNFVQTEAKTHKKEYHNFYTLATHFFLQNAKTKPSVYVVCSAIANFLTLIFPNIDGFIYPTVQGNTGYNFVLRPHVLDKEMIVPNNTVCMKKWCVKSADNMEVDPDFETFGKISNGKIGW
jgi:hypothetical protein